MKSFVSSILAGLVALLMPMAAVSAPSAQETTVVRQETRWLAAIVAGDVNTIQAILAPGFMHTTADGELLDRTQEIASTKKESFTMNPSAVTVDFAGNVAIVRGINSVMQAGKRIAHERFTDVFVLQHGSWLALSAQESAIKP